MKKLILSCILTTAMIIANAQAPALQWAKQIAGPSTIADGRSVTADAAGNVYTTGFFSGTVDFDPGAGVVNFTAANLDIFISKIDAAGNFVWAKQLGGPIGGFGNYGLSIAIDVLGNVYTTGYFGGTVDFDPGPGVYNLSVSNFNINPNIDNAFISKLDAAGNFVWAKQINNATSNSLIRGQSIAVDAAANVYVTGYFSGTANFPGGVISLSEGTAKTIFVVKLDVDGNTVWAKNMGGPHDATISIDIPEAIAVDASGNVYTTGRFSGTADFDPGAGVFNLIANTFYYGIFISKLDASGNFVWAKQMPQGSSVAIIESLAMKMDAAGNIYTTGRFKGTIDFDPGAGVFNLVASDFLYDIFVSKLDASGNFVWAKKMGGAEDDVSFGITVDASGNVYTAGYFTNTADFDPGPANYNLSSAGSVDIFISKLDFSGNFVWAVRMGGPNFEYASSVAVDASQNVYATGRFTGVVDFNPGAGVFNLTSAGSTDMYIVKLGQSVLAIKLLSFTGRNNGNNNLLEWSTTSETNNDHFDIERSADGIVFEKIAAVKGAGNSSIVKQYQFTDNFAFKSSNYYRLKQVDADGKFSYSDIINLKRAKDNLPINIYPNPFKNNFSIDLAAAYKNVVVSISDITGKKISESIYTQVQLINIKTNAPAGVYLVKIMSDNKIITTQKIIKE
jgi:Secretion system C-terminal sorting domain/Beta-propeller repeat